MKQEPQRTNKTKRRLLVQKLIEQQALKKEMSALSGPEKVEEWVVLVKQRPGIEVIYFLFFFLRPINFITYKTI